MRDNFALVRMAVLRLWRICFADLILTLPAGLLENVMYWDPVAIASSWYEEMSDSVFISEFFSLF